MTEVPTDEILLSALTDLRSIEIFGVKNLRQVYQSKYICPKIKLISPATLNVADTYDCEMENNHVFNQALLKVHPDWCVGEKRIRSLNRLLNDNVPCDFKLGAKIFRESSCDNNDDDCDWEVLVKTGEIDWVFVEKPVEL